VSVETITLGCRLNFAESETIRRLAKTDENWVVINSCAVTNEAVRQTRQVIRKTRRQSPEVRILVTGCAAELDPESFTQMVEVDRVVGNDHKIGSLNPEAGKLSQIIPAGFLGHVRSFVAIQNGCDHRCTFCSIWQARGPSRSLSFEAIREAVERELGRGAKEVVLTGVDITSYELDGMGLGRLCQRLLATIPDLGRLRLSSLDSVEIDDALMELIAGEPPAQPCRGRSDRGTDQGRSGRRHHRRRPDCRISDRI
jgi:threonylcarbamoyladenosine tRNA methylthiotransferase MtaB